MRLISDGCDGPVWDLTLTPSEGAGGAITLDSGGLTSLEEHLRRAADDPSCRVLVLRGEAGQFCRGMDLGEVTTGHGSDPAASVAAFARCLERIPRLDAAVICAVDGEATGGGVGLAAAADIVVATARSTFDLPELVLGLVPAVILPALTLRMPLSRARWMALTGARVPAEAAERMGLVDEVSADEASLTADVRRIVKRLLRSRPQAVAGLKRLALAPRLRALEAGLRAGVERTAADVSDPETVAATQGLLAGESPPWFQTYRPARIR